MRYVFSEVKASGEKRGPCIHCGVRRTRRITSTSTENPWNIGEDGLPKTRREIFEWLVNQKITPWKSMPIICKACAAQTLWTVHFRQGEWTVYQCRDHSGIGEVLWEPKYDSGHCVVYALTADDARSIGITTLTDAMQEERATP